MNNSVDRTFGHVVIHQAETKIKPFFSISAETTYVPCTCRRPILSSDVPGRQVRTHAYQIRRDGIENDDNIVEI